MDGASRKEDNSNDGGTNVSGSGTPRSSSAVNIASATSSTPKATVPRPPLNVYLKIAIIRHPTDTVTCEDVENPGTWKKVVVSDLLDPAKEAKEANERDDVEDISKRDREEGDGEKEQLDKTPPSKKSRLEKDASPTKKKTESNGDNAGTTNVTEKTKKPKVEIPVPTITTVNRYYTDVPPTYPVPKSYVRYVTPSYDEIMDGVYSETSGLLDGVRSGSGERKATIDYNVDIEDEEWWTNNPDFGPNSKARVVYVPESSLEKYKMEKSWIREECQSGDDDTKSKEDEKKKGAKAKTPTISNVMSDKKKRSKSIISSNTAGKESGAGSSDAKSTPSKDSASPIDPMASANTASAVPTPTIEHILLNNPKFLYSPHSTGYLIRKYQPRLPLQVFEQMIDALEKATGFDFIMTNTEAEEILTKRIPALERIFGPIEGNKDDDELTEEYTNDPTQPRQQSLAGKEMIEKSSSKSSSNLSKVASASKSSGSSKKSKSKSKSKGKSDVNPSALSAALSNNPASAEPSTAQSPTKDEESNVKTIATLASPVSLRKVIHQVYDYWMQKRCKLKKPLLRRFWPVTASNDTNPHMVFRPREKEKRKLRKKRQNDLEAYNKMKQLKMDFQRVKVLCDLILRREITHSLNVELTNEYFEERLYEWMDTSGTPRESKVLTKNMIESVVVDVPKYFDDGPIVKVKGGKKRKRGSATGSVGGAGMGLGTGALQNQMDVDSRDTSPVPPVGVISAANQGTHPPKALAAASPPPRNVVVAGHDGGYPAPNFLQPLASRESFYTSNWQNSVPFIPSFVNGKQVSTDRFRHRPRLGRGGRIVIDRLPCPTSSEVTYDGCVLSPPTVVTYGSGMNRCGYDIATLGADGPNYNINEVNANGRIGEKTKSEYGGGGTNVEEAPKAPPARSLQDLMPRPLGDRKSLSRRIEEICAMGLVEDYDVSTEASSLTGRGTSSVAGTDDMDEILVPIEDWMEAPNDGQIYGTENFVIGPL